MRVMMLTVDSITGGNRERDKRTGFAIPFRLNLAGIAQFMAKPGWALNYFTHERFRLPQLDGRMDMGGGVMSISRYFTEMLDPSMTWDDVAEMVAHWGGQFCLKGVMSVEDARRAADIGCTGIVLSNHGGRQLDGSRSAFDQLAEIVDAVGDRIDVMMDGGVRRGTHAEGAVAGRQGRGAGTLLPVPAGGCRPAGSGARAGSDAGGDRAGVAVDGVQVGEGIGAGESAVPVARGWACGARDSAAPCRCARVHVRAAVATQ